MNRSHQTPTHRLRSGAVWRSVIGAALLAAAGLSFLLLKHQLHVAGARKQALETELRDLSQRGRVLEARIAELTSRTALQARLKDGFIHMVDIPGPSVVHVKLLPGGTTGPGLASAGNGEDTAADADARALRAVSHDDRAALRTVRR